jgi:hypothetical protein
MVFLILLIRSQRVLRLRLTGVRLTTTPCAALIGTKNPHFRIGNGDPWGLKGEMNGKNTTPRTLDPWNPWILFAMYFRLWMDITL